LEINGKHGGRRFILEKKWQHFGQSAMPQEGTKYIHLYFTKEAAVNSTTNETKA